MFNGTFLTAIFGDSGLALEPANGQQSQTWTVQTIAERPGEYHIINVDEEGNYHYMIGNASDRSVSLQNEPGTDWLIESVPGTEGLLNVRTQGLFLSTTTEGYVDLWSEDDGSGRQRWIFTDIG